MKKYRFNLQLFAEMNTQTTLLDAVGNDLSAEMKTYYCKQLLEDAKPNLVHDQFGQKRSIPRNGGKNIEWRRFSSLPVATTPLVEGVTPDGNKLNVTPITATVQQYGDYIVQSDVLELTSIDNTILQATHVLGNQAGLTLDTIVRDQMNAGTNVIFAGDGVTERANLTIDCKLNVDLVFRAARNLKRQNAPKIGNEYVAIIHPDVSYDLMRCEEWIDAHKYATPENIYNGEIGKIGNVRFVESTQSKIFTGDGCPEGLAVYSTLVLGADAYGTVDIEGGGLEHIVKQRGSAGVADPLNQRSSIGWKAMSVAKILDDTRLVRIESCSTFSASATAN